MKVLLWKDIDKLGKRGDEVDVANGYARNYLFPRKIASMNTEASKRALEKEKKQLIKQEAEFKSNLKQIAQKIEQSSCTIEVRANEDGVLFGSVTPELILESLAKEGVSGLKPQMVEIKDPIKELGVYRVQLNLSAEVTATCRLWVVEENISKKAKEAKESVE